MNINELKTKIKQSDLEDFLKDYILLVVDTAYELGQLDQQEQDKETLSKVLKSL